MDRQCQRRFLSSILDTNSWNPFTYLRMRFNRSQSSSFGCAAHSEKSQHVADVACPLPSILVPLCSCTPTVFCTPFFSRRLGSVSSSCSDSHKHLSSLCCASPPLSLPAGVATVLVSDKCKASDTRLLRMTIVFARRLDSPIILCIDSKCLFAFLFTYSSSVLGSAGKMSFACTITPMLRSLKQNEHVFASPCEDPCSIKTVAKASSHFAAA